MLFFGMNSLTKKFTLFLAYLFRVPGDIDDVNQLKLLADNWQTPEHKSDPTVPASLLKLWFRDLYEPLIPQRFYDQCIHNCDNPEISLNIIHSLPPLNRLIFSYLIRLLQVRRFLFVRLAISYTRIRNIGWKLIISLDIRHQNQG